jgi:hypothetical protein
VGDQWSEIEERRQQIQDGSRRLLILGAVVAGAFFAGTHFFGKPREEPAPVGALEAMIVPVPAIEVPQVIEPTRPTNRAPASAPGRQTYVGVYECTVNGQRFVSDEPCGPDAQARTLVVDQPDPVEAARQRQQTRAAQQRATSSSTSVPSSGGVPSTRNTVSSDQAACESVERQIAYVDAQMREGYRSQAGETYREQLRVLKERRHDLRCLRGD